MQQKVEGMIREKWFWIALFVGLPLTILWLYAIFVIVGEMMQWVGVMLGLS